MSDEPGGPDLPAWSGAFVGQGPDRVTGLPLPEPRRDWAWAGGDGTGVKVAIIDSGVDADHPAVGGLAGSVAIEPAPDTDDGFRVEDVEPGDLYGHGTACAGIVRALAPGVELWSVRVLGSNLKGKTSAFYGGIRWAIDHGMQVANMSLSSKSDAWFAALHEVVDDAYFANLALVAIQDLHRRVEAVEREIAELRTRLG